VLRNEWELATGKVDQGICLFGSNSFTSPQGNHQQPLRIDPQQRLFWLPALELMQVLAGLDFESGVVLILNAM
jgi:hypothetical protein